MLIPLYRLQGIVCNPNSLIFSIFYRNTKIAIFSPIQHYSESPRLLQFFFEIKLLQDERTKFQDNCIMMWREVDLGVFLSEFTWLYSLKDLI